MTIEYVSVLPYRRYNDKIELLVKDDLNLNWGNFPVRCILGEKIVKDAESDVIKIIKDQAGYKSKKSDLIYLQFSYGEKHTSSKYHIYSVDLTGIKRMDDNLSYDQCAWVNYIVSNDPQLYISYYRLVKHLKTRVLSGYRLNR